MQAQQQTAVDAARQAAEASGYDPELDELLQSVRDRAVELGAARRSAAERGLELARKREEVEEQAGEIERLKETAESARQVRGGGAARLRGGGGGAAPREPSERGQSPPRGVDSRPALPGVRAARGHPPCRRSGPRARGGPSRAPGRAGERVRRPTRSPGGTRPRSRANRRGSRPPGRASPSWSRATPSCKPAWPPARRGSAERSATALQKRCRDEPRSRPGSKSGSPSLARSRKANEDAKARLATAERTLERARADEAAARDTARREGGVAPAAGGGAGREPATAHRVAGRDPGRHRVGRPGRRGRGPGGADPAARSRPQGGRRGGGHRPEPADDRRGGATATAEAAEAALRDARQRAESRDAEIARAGFDDEAAVREALLDEATATRLREQVRSMRRTATPPRSGPPPSSAELGEERVSDEQLAAVETARGGRHARRWRPRSARKRGSKSRPRA